MTFVDNRTQQNRTEQKKHFKRRAATKGLAQVIKHFDSFEVILLSYCMLQTCWKRWFNFTAFTLQEVTLPLNLRLTVSTVDACMGQEGKTN